VRQTRVVQRHHQQLLTPDVVDAAAVDWQCYSAPQSRSGSFKKMRHGGGGGGGWPADASPRSSLPSLEDSITAKLLELQQLEADDCRVVREFVTSARGGIVHRADSFRRNKDDDDAAAPNATSTQTTTVVSNT